MIDKKSKYKIIEDDILSKIHSGYYPESAVIPKEVDLATIYGVSRPTVRQAIQKLVNEGYLERKKRKGTIVRQKMIRQDFTHTIESFNSEMSNKGLPPKTKVLTFKEDTASKEVAKNLNIKEGQAVFKLVRLRYAKDMPVVLVTTYLPKTQLPGFLEHDFTTKTLYSVLADYNLNIKRITRRLDVIKADETISDLLSIPVGDPVFYFHSVGSTSGNLTVEYSISKYRGDVNSFVFEVIKR